MATAIATDYMEQQALNYFRDQIDGEPTSVVAQLYTGSPGEDGTGGTIVAGWTGNTQQTVSWAAPNLSGIDYEMKNSALIDWGTAQDDTDVIDYIGLISTDSPDPMLFYIPLTPTKTLLTGEAFTIGIDSLRIESSPNWGQTAQQALLDWVRGQSITAPAAVYVGLYTTNPTSQGGGVEVTTSIRAAGRLAVTFGAPVVDGEHYKISNTAKIDFGTSDSTLGSVLSGFGIFDAASAGNLLYWGSITNNLNPIQAGDSVFFNIGNFSIRIG